MTWLIVWLAFLSVVVLVNNWSRGTWTNDVELDVDLLESRTTRMQADINTLLAGPAKDVRDDVLRTYLLALYNDTFLHSVRTGFTVNEAGANATTAVSNMRAAFVEYKN